MAINKSGQRSDSKNHGRAEVRASEAPSQRGSRVEPSHEQRQAKKQNASGKKKGK